MSYSNRGLGLMMMAPQSTPSGATPVPTKMIVRMPTQAQIDAGRAASAPVASIVTADCADYKYVVRYKPLRTTGIVRAGTPIVAGKKISWDSTKIGADFPRSWMDWVNHNADDIRKDVDHRAWERAQTTRSPVKYLGSVTKAFMIGFSMLGPSTAILYSGAVSTVDVDMELMQYFVRGMLRTKERVEPPGFGLTAYAEVPLSAPGIVEVAPTTDWVTIPARIGPTYNINEARSLAISSAIALTEGLQVLISGEIFGGIAVGAVAPLFIPGEREVFAAVSALGGVADLGTLPGMLATATSSMLAEAEAAKTQPQTDGDKTCADILSRLNTMRDALAADIGGKVSTLAAGTAALPGAQAAASAYAGNARATETRTRQLVQDKINVVESKPGFLRLTDGEKRAVHCIMLNRAAPVVAQNTAVAQPRVDAIASISAADFPASCASASAAYEAALAQANSVINDAIAKVEAIRKQIALEWYARDFHGFPVWMWGAGGAVLLVGGAVAVRVMRKKKAPAALPVK